MSLSRLCKTLHAAVTTLL